LTFLTGTPKWSCRGRWRCRTCCAAVIVTMQNYLAELGAWVTVIQGVIFVACVLAFRRGIIGELANLLKVKL